ncbi:hypothetical protein ABB37_05964 [Leptomonas pyrrhocoris]|uniref:Uncharacterized protein n=1 Tax=Leptomonas pyrrhocoris TaxID=157538 RepID=A0A0M9FYS8_LEPPY|nr:hypothetical protein ABB37_05964 [Leptomonas pyrrhocoris]KPA78900.1 hypothetical protein ABB37_05964 [Leptomonas pyrrhocoris]|eukprot:XP_015657339.1 hypothetical protein ABB37_05964 [Leptomonas pyrrhocoris]
MGLVPSRESLHAAATAPDTPLPYISRPVESYVYKTNRTERTFGSGVPGVVTGMTALPAALPSATTAVLHGAPSLELSQKVTNELPDAVFIDDPAEATAAVASAMAANRPARRGGGSGGPKGKAQGEAPGGTAAEESTAAQALRSGKVPFVYYYEHRVLPLTQEFFPSPDCVLFRQLWHARQQQNPRYHFQLDQTWSPGALLDPTAHYESFVQLATSNLADVQATCLTAAGAAPTRGSVLQAQADLEAAKAELNVAEGGPTPARGSAGGKAAPSPVPFATRAAFYNLVVRTTEESMLYESDDALRHAVRDAASTGDAGAQRRRRLRPVPCAIVLVRRCMTAQEYRYTYYLASHERHHRPTDGAAAAAADTVFGGVQRANSGPRRGLESQRRDVQAIAVTGNAVRTAVEEAQRALRARRGPDGSAWEAHDEGEESLMVPWLQVSAPQTPLDLAEVRVVGMYGCWTLEEILRHSLFLPMGPRSASTEKNVNGAAVVSTQEAAQDAETQARIDAILRRACPHGVPSSTLLNVGFFEKQVGDKEQCHTYFSLCRLFAHGMRECLLRDVIRAASVSVLATTLGADDTGDGPMDVESERERMEAELREMKRQQEHPTWQRFLRLLAGENKPNGCGGGGGGGAHDEHSAFADLANCFLIRFSYVPQLQLCRQLRLLLTGMASMYPEPISLEAFQAAQRQRNVAAMAKKQHSTPGASDAEGHGGVAVVGGGSSKGTTAPPTPYPGRTAEAAFTPLADPAQGSITSLTTNTPDAAGTPHAAGGEQTGGVTQRQPEPPRHPAGPTLDPEAVAERRQEHTSEMQKLQRDGFCCYASDGLVVFRISRGCVARALNQLGFALMRDSIEALCVTLTAAAPPPLTYRGELRPPMTIGNAGVRASTRPISATGSTRDDDDDGDMANYDDADACEDGEHTTVNSASATSITGTDRDGAASLDVTMTAVRDLYWNAVRYSSDAATGFAAQRLFHHRSSSTDAAPEFLTQLKVAPLGQAPSELIGVLPRNPIEQRRGRLLPLRGLLLQEARVNHLHAAAATTATAVDAGAVSDPSAHANASFLFTQQQQLVKVSEQHQFDVYTVSADFDGMPFRRLVELTHQVEQQRHRPLCSGGGGGGGGEEWPEMFIEAVDAQGNAELDSVLDWSPMTAFTKRIRRSEHRGVTSVSDTATATAENAAGHGEANNGGEATAPVHLSQTPHSALDSVSSYVSGRALNPITVPIRVHDPDRILHTGDRIRFATSHATSTATTAHTPSTTGNTQGLSSLLGDVTSPSSTSAEFISLHSTPAGTPPRRPHKAGSGTTAVRCGYWYVDDALTTEDVVLSWMRRVSGRARETRGNDTKWVRYPNAMLSVLLQFVRECRQRPSGSWLNTGHPLRLLHPMDEELVEWDMLQNFPDIVRTRRFRQWRFSHDGYVYFHGVTVRMPGSAPPLQAAPLPSPKLSVAAAQPDTATPTPEPSTKLTARDGPARVRHADAANPAAISTPAQKSAPLGVRQPQYQQQQQQQNVFAGVPRPPPVVQRGVYGSTPPHMEGPYGDSNPYPNTNYQPNVSPRIVYQMSPFNPNGIPRQKQRQFQQQQQFQLEQQPYQQMPSQQVPPQQPYYYANPANANNGVQPPLPPQPPQRQNNVTMYVPVTYTVEPYYMQQPATIVSIPQPPANVSVTPPSLSSFQHNNSSSNSNTLYFGDTDAANAPARNGGHNDTSGRSMGGGNQQMHFSLHHVDSETSLRSYDLAASNAMLEPTRVTGSFYGEFCGQSPQQLQQPPPVPPQQQPQQLTPLMGASMHSTSDCRNEAWQGSDAQASQGMQTPDGSALTSTPMHQDLQTCPPTTGADVRTNPGIPHALHALTAQGGTQRMSLHPQPQQQRYDSVQGSNVSRRSTADYPPRRIGATFLAGGNNNNSSSSGSGDGSGGNGKGTALATVAHPTVQRAVSRPIQTVHVDPTKREVVTTAGETGAPLRLPIPKIRTAQRHDEPSAPTPLHSQQQLQGPVSMSPHLSSASGSFRDVAAAAAAGAPTDVIEADGITVHVMQRKPSVALRRAMTSVSLVSPVSARRTAWNSSSFNGGGGGPLSPQAVSHHTSGFPHTASTGDVEAAAAAACYGAMGVSPTGGVDATITGAGPTTAASATSPEDCPDMLALVSYEMPAALTPMSSSQANSSRAGGGTRATATGVTTPPQRHRSGRVAHNPYATHDMGTAHAATSPTTTTSTLAHTSSYTHGGGGGDAHGGTATSGRAQELPRGPSGQDAFQAALDAQYGGSNDFGAAAGRVSSSYLAPQKTTSATAHGVLYSRSGGSLTAEVQEKHNSFYAAPEGEGEPVQSYSSHEMYRDRIADGTTQGFYFSMDGPNEEEGNAAQQLYGRDDSAGGRSRQRLEGSLTRTGSTPYGNIPAPPALHRSQRGSYQ